MWFVVQVVGGRERTVLRKIRGVADPATFKECFVPEREAMKRVSGEWRRRREVLFPGYVFVDTKTPDSFRIELGKVSAMTKLLSGEDENGERRFMPLSDEEKTLIAAFIGDDEHVLRMSEGVIVGDEVRVLKGPLAGHEALVRKIDRRKRVAYLGIEMLGRSITVKVGLEIVEKR